MSLLTTGGDSETFHCCEEAPSLARANGQLFLSTHLLLLSCQDQNTVLELRVKGALSLSSPSSVPDKNTSVTASH